MKLPLTKLEQHLNTTLASLYVLSGDDLLQSQEASDLIRKKAILAGFSERVKLEEDADWAKNLFATAHSLSLFATKRFIELDLRGAKLNQKSMLLLQSYLEKPATHTILLIYTAKIDAKTEKSAWYQTLIKEGIVIPIWPISEEQLPQWIFARAKKNNLPITLTEATQLADFVAGNLLAASQEIEKLRLLKETHIDIEKHLTDSAHFDVFQLVDALLQGDVKRSIRILRHLRAENSELTLINWAIARELRLMIDIHRKQKEGDNLPLLFKQLRIFEKREPGIRSFLKRHNESVCCQLLLKTAHIDRIIKGIETTFCPWAELEELVLSLTRA